MSTEMAGQLPNFLYIGPDKAGSSWLHEVLIQHPEVFLSEAKDLYFFDRYYDRGMAWYASQFRRATRSISSWARSVRTTCSIRRRRTGSGPASATTYG